MVLDAVVDLASTEFSDGAGTWQGELPMDDLRTFADHGFLGVNFDDAYGGADMT